MNPAGTANVAYDPDGNDPVAVSCMLLNIFIMMTRILHIHLYWEVY